MARPRRPQVVAEGQDRGALDAGERGGTGCLAAGEFGFGGGQLGEGFLQGGFQAAGDQPVFRVDGLVAALGPGGLVGGPARPGAGAGQGRVVALLDLPGGLQAGLQRGRSPGW